jgi:hypothetical protein
LDDEVRRKLIERFCKSNEKEWLTPYFGLMESNDTDNMGGATKDIIKMCMEEEAMPRDVTFITVMPMHKLDGMVRVSQSLAYNENKAPQTYSQ